MKKAKGILCMLLALVMMISLFACGNTNKSGNDAQSPGTASAAPGSAAPDSAAPDAPNKPAAITIGCTGWLGRFLDGASPAPNYGACDLVYDTVFKIDTATKAPYSNILSDWKYTDDTTLVMTLKPGVQFANGDMATADDLLFSITNQFDRSSANVGSMGPIDLGNCTSDGKYSVTIKFTKPYGPGFYGIPLFMYDKAWSEKVGWESQDWYSNPNGTGPYKVTEYVTDDHITLQLRDNYWNAANEKFDVDKWVIKYYPDASTMYMALELGDISLCAVPNSADYSRWKSEGVKNVGMEVINMGDVMLFMMGYTNNDIFRDKKVREALAYGVDWAAIGQLAAGDLFKQPTSTIVSDSPFYKNVGFYQYDLEKAKKILADAGYKEGDLTLHLYEMSTDQRKIMAEAFQFYCSELGIKVDIEFGDVTSALAKWQEPGGSDAGFLSNVNGSITREPNNSFSFMTQTLFTWCVCDDPYFLEKANEAVATVDPAKRKVIYEDLQQYMFDNFIVFPMFETTAVVAFRTDVFTQAQINTNVYNGNYFNLHGLSLAD